MIFYSNSLQNKIFFDLFSFVTNARLKTNQPNKIKLNKKNVTPYGIDECSLKLNRSLTNAFRTKCDLKYNRNNGKNDKKLHLFYIILI